MLCCDLGTFGKTGNLENTFEVALFLLKKESTTFNLCFPRFLKKLMVLKL